MAWGRPTRNPGNSIQEILTAVSAAYFACPDLEFTGRCLLPESILTAIMQSGNDQRPIMQFAIRNNRVSTVIYAGVKDFTASPTTIVLPAWMLSFLQADEGDRVSVTLSSEGALQTATRATFRPEQKTFSDLPNTRVILEKALREHPCLTQGTVFPVQFNDRIYNLRVLKLEPAKIVSAFRADVATDFAPHVSEFNHVWNARESDSDSSSDTELIRANMPKTLKDKAVVLTQPLRSTLEKREKERKTRPPPVGVTLFEAGQPIAPPKAPEAKRKPDAFKGVGKVLKRKKGVEEEVRTVKSEVAVPLSAAFQGKPRRLKDPVVESVVEDGQSRTQSQSQKGASAFVGRSRTLREGSVEAKATEEVAAGKVEVQGSVKGKVEEPVKSAFQGTPRRLGRK